MPLFQMASCCFSCFKGGFIVIVRMRSSMIVRCVSKFFSCCIQSFFCLVFMLIDQFIFNVLKYLSIGALSYGYPALLILCVTAIRLQYSVKSLEVYWLPWSLCKIKYSFDFRLGLYNFAQCAYSKLWRYIPISYAGDNTSVMQIYNCTVISLASIW